MNRVRVRTPARLHFGLFGWGPHTARQFGGVGLMVDEPGLEVLVEPSRHWGASGPLAPRALAIARGVAERLRDDGREAGPVRITTLRAPEAHRGLGVGTQLSLAVARVLTELAGTHDVPVTDLARMTSRGRRSGIGIHGFAHGGLIVDGGRGTSLDVPTLLFHQACPRDWHVLIVVPESEPGLHGPDEIGAFESLPPLCPESSGRICRLVLLGLLPAVIENDLDAFGRALSEIQEVVGSAFAPVQGGRFANPHSGALVARMRALGLTGVGQSSWGPTLYGLSDRDERHREAIRSTLASEFGLPADRILWTHANDSGATCLID